MSRSPYAPPETPAALVLIILVLCHEVARFAGGYGSWFFPSSVWIVVLVGFLFLIERGHGWARWLLLVLTVLSSLQLAAFALAPAPPGVRMIPDVGYVARTLAAQLCLITATILVFGPGRAWVRR